MELHVFVCFLGKEAVIQVIALSLLFYYISFPFRLLMRLIFINICDLKEGCNFLSNEQILHLKLFN
jgi:hypothetical protein